MRPGVTVSSDAASSPRDGRLRRWVPLLAWAGAVAALGALAVTRSYPGFGTETDFLGGFVPEAINWLSREPLEVNFHPPLYSLLLGLGRLTGAGWFQVGLFISWLAAALALWMNFSFFKGVFGKAAAWGSVIALGTSGTFVAFAAQATSDVPFFALYSAALLVALVALNSRPTGVKGWALLLGALIGAVLLFRMNGLPLLLLIFVPWLRAEPVRERLQNTAVAAAGLLLVMGAWGLYAHQSGSPFYPTENHANLAMTYFGEGDRVSWEDLLAMDARFSSTREVLLHSPAAVFRQYVRDLVELPRRALDSGAGLLSLPLALFALPGVLLLFLRRRRPFPLLFLGVVALQVLLMNFKTFEPRYYLFLIPVLGAGAGVLAVELARLLKGRPERFAAAGLLLGLLLVDARDSAWEARESLLRDDAELSEAIEAARLLVEPEALLVARKPHVPFYIGVDRKWIPMASGVEELAAELETAGQDRPVYLYFGSQEWWTRPGLRGLAEPDGASPAFEPVALGEAAPWVLYRLRSPVPRSGAEP